MTQIRGSRDAATGNGRGRSVRTFLAGAAGLSVIVAGAGLLVTATDGLARPGAPGGQIQLPTTVADFFQPGTQPEPDPEAFDIVLPSNNCYSCHGEYLGPDADDLEPWDGWVASMMAQSARDPVWHAALAIANQDANVSGEFCIRCHAPAGWLAGRSTSGTVDDFEPQHFDGVNCNFCHRMVDPEYVEGVSPPQDEAILAALDFPPDPHQHGNGRFVVDPTDTRRGPYDDVPFNFHAPIEIIPSAFHRESAVCASCHDVSNPAFSLDPKSGELVLNDTDAPHPTQDPNEMLAEQRTYSEWLNSQFAKGGVYFEDGRFGGNHPTGVMESCQDCHMPDVFAGGCFAWEFEPFFAREDLGRHTFAGANTWVLGAVFDLYGFDSGLDEDRVSSARARTETMLRNASDMELERCGDELKVRIVNMSGHKLPTGYPEGRRMWINVQFLDDVGGVVAERGVYDWSTAELETADTKVYEAKYGMSEEVAAATGLEPGPSFHLVLNNVVEFDNRIPPIGFENAAFEAIRAAPVGVTYADGQHWDDTFYDIPSGAESAVVTLYYQTTTKEYIEFLRDANVTNDAGQTVYDLWLARGMSAPVDMDVMSIDLAGGGPGGSPDLDGDGFVDTQDLLILLAAWGPCPAEGCSCPADIDGDGTVATPDLLELLAAWGSAG